MDNKASPTIVNHFIGDEYVAPSSGEYMDVVNPNSDSKVIGKCALGSSQDVDKAVKTAEAAFPKWSSLTIKARAAIMMKFHALIVEHTEELARIIVEENGKNLTEARADVAKANETVEYACSLPQLAQGRNLQVSGAVSCQDRRVPLGVVASIVPFNFPIMVPMWTVPIALVLGNTVICKPSEKVPLTMCRVSELFIEAGFPKGVFNMVQGTREAAEAIIDHPSINAVTFVGSSPVAEIVSKRCRDINKRCTALGGAKNHLVALPDAEIESAAQDICVSFAGCAGQRCMAASVLITIGDSSELVAKVVENAKKLQPGVEPGQMGPVIDGAAVKRILSYIEDSEKQGAEILLDGRPWTAKGKTMIGPTIIKHKQSTDKTMLEEVFGPVLSVYEANSWEEAVEIENANPFGNAASIYTTNGGNADWFLSRFRAAMLGVNIGIPVPREPFSFGGLYGTKSKYGDMDITGDGAIEFFSNRIKVTSKWPVSKPKVNGKRSFDAVENGSGVDRANFAGSM